MKLRLARVVDDYLLLNRIQRKDFAADTGLSASVVTRWLNGRAISEENLAAVLRWLLDEVSE